MKGSYRSSKRQQRQAVVVAWARRCFGKAQAEGLPQRGIRMLEEAVEAAQAAGVTETMALQMVRYVYSRPKGELAQEIGGVGIALLCLAEAAGVDADGEEQRELTRVLAIPEDTFRQRNKAKNDAGFLAVGAR